MKRLATKSLLFLCAAYSSFPDIADAHGGISSLAGFRAWLYTMIVAAGVIAATFLLVAAQHRRTSNGTTTKVILLATPAIVYAIGAFLALIDVRPDAYSLSAVCASLATWIALIFLLLRTTRNRALALSAVFLAGISMALTNPGLINIWNYEDVDNDPFDGAGLRIVQVNPRYEMAIKGRREYLIDDDFTLEDGRQFRGSIRVEQESLDRLSKVIVKQGLFDETWKVIAHKRVERREWKPLVDLPIMRREYKLNKTYELGEAYILQLPAK
jgi:hypothetical protein